LNGQTILIATLPASSIRPVTNREIAHARTLSAVG